MRRNSFKDFHNIFPFLKPLELIEQFSVFEGYENLDSLHDNTDIFDNIMLNILKRYHLLKELFVFDEHTQKLLHKIAIGDRKQFSVLKKSDISQIKSRSIYKQLFESGIIHKELSREKPLRKNSKQQIKKEFRGYMIEDKIQFCKQFYRFWFTFIYPHQELLENKKYDKVLEKIKLNLDKYISLTFEYLSNDFVYDFFLHDKIVQSGSYWDKDIEIDLLAKTTSGKIIAGECKYKNQKICKNTLTKLQKKCQKAKLNVDIYALFSKSGFSKELLKIRSEKLLLFDASEIAKL